MSDLYREEPEMILDLVEEENKKKMEKQTAEEEVSEEDIENVLAILEKFGQSDTGRLNVHVSDEVAGGAARKVSHHGDVMWEVRGQREKPLTCWKNQKIQDARKRKKWN